MPYVTSIERLAKKEGMREMLLEAVLTRFKSIPKDVAAAVNSIKAVDMLKALFRQAILCQNLDDFRKTLLAAQDGQSQA
ncbi:MAG: hypothetical protein R2941_13835 [Desulfobacterales bacterium]